jgi:hypothetical protein
VDEVHRVWWDRQGSHAQMSKNFWLWDMVFQGFDARGDSLTEVLVYLTLLHPAVTTFALLCHCECLCMNNRVD